MNADITQNTAVPYDMADLRRDRERLEFLMSCDGQSYAYTHVEWRGGNKAFTRAEVDGWMKDAADNRASLLKP